MPPSFDVLISMDWNMPVEQDISSYRIGLVLIRASSNRIEALRAIVPAIQRALAAVRPGQVSGLVANSACQQPAAAGTQIGA